MKKLKREYRAVRLQGSDRPFRAPGKLVHAQELNTASGEPFYFDMTVCGRQPRDPSAGLNIVPTGNYTCPRCKERLR